MKITAPDNDLCQAQKSPPGQRTEKVKQYKYFIINLYYFVILILFYQIDTILSWHILIYNPKMSLKDILASSRQLISREKIIK